MRRISTLLPIPVMRRISTLFCQSRSCGGSPHFFANPGHAEDLHSTYLLLADFANPGHAEDLHTFANPGHAEDLHTFCKSWSCGGSPHFCKSRSCGGSPHFE